MIFIGGAVGIAVLVAVIGLLQRPMEFWAGYLTAVVFWLGTSLGCLGIALLHALTGGRWGTAISRDLRAGLSAGLVGLVAGVAVAFAAATLYPGVASETATPLNAHQQSYLAVPLVVGRFVLAAVVWVGLGGWLLWGDVRRSANPEFRLSARKAALGLMAFWLTVTFAVVDGVLSLTPGWFSSLFPVMEIVGFAVAGMALAILVRAFANSGNNGTETERRATHDLGNLLLAFNLVWVYLAFSQYLIIWSGDLPHEVTWYLDRRDPVTAGVSVALFALHFVVPFGLLLSRDIKRSVQRLACVAGLLLLMRLVAVAWTILPATEAEGLWAVVLVIANWTALGGVWLLVFRAVRSRLPEIAASNDEPSAAAAVGESAEGSA